VKLPRDIGGEELANLLRKHGYQTTRQTGSHLRLTSSSRGKEHHVTVPKHKALRVGTLNSLLKDIASYLKMERQLLTEELFKK